MLIWPLPEDKSARVRLVAHELFHRVQDDLGLPASNPANNHLDSLEGRIWLQMEWRALLAAVMTRSGGERRAVLEDALVFRSLRRELFPGAASDERLLEMNEDLAEYTGVKMSATALSESADYLVAAQIVGAGKRQTFVRSFAYVSGPLWGDGWTLELSEGWKLELSKPCNNVLSTAQGKCPLPQDESLSSRPQACLVVNVQKLLPGRCGL